MVRRTSEKTNFIVPLSEIRFRFSRSGGAGGQHVNKVSTRVELLFDLRTSVGLTGDQKDLLFARLASRLDDAGVLRVVADDSRSQWKNREIALERFNELLRHALTPRRKRVATRAHRGAHERRLRKKKLRGRRKTERRERDSG